MSQLDDSPKLNPRTLKLIQEIKSRRKPVNDYSSNNYHWSNNEHGENEKLTLKLANQLREGSALDRLYDLNFRMDDLRKQKELERRQSESNLYNSINTNENRNTFSPELNSLSLEIANKLPMSSRERLLSPFNKSNSSCESPYSFKPQICKKSVIIDAEKNKFETFEQRVNDMYKRSSKTKKKLENKKKELVDKELEGCTFSPNVSKTITKASNLSSFNGKSIVDRGAVWDKKRKLKIAKEKIELENKELEGCTFSPVLNRPQSSRSSPAVSTKDEGIIEPVGFDEFIQRQRIARNRKKEIENVFKYGDKWKNQITVPKEFAFNLKDSIKIKSLFKPISPQLANKKTNYFDSTMNVSVEEVIQYDVDTENLEEENMIAEFTIQTTPKSVTSTSFQSNTSQQSDSSDVPPPGLFSSKLSTSIIGSNTLTPPKANNNSNYNSTNRSGYETLFSNFETISPSNEWLRRSKLKEEEDNVKSYHVPYTD
ncbi:hypothetical protein ABK040_001237 [Willaertia magna]